MIKQEMQDAINKQIVREIYSSNLYLSMSAYFAAKSLHGFANWMRIQAEEEMTHALKFFDYLLDRGGKPVVGEISAPPTEWSSALDAFENAYHHEQLVTGWINELADLSQDIRDHASFSEMQWFITEQIEEEATSSEIVDRLKLVGNDSSGLFYMDNELKARKPAAVKVAAK